MEDALFPPNWTATDILLNTAAKQQQQQQQQQSTTQQAISESNSQQTILTHHPHHQDMNNPPPSSHKDTNGDPRQLQASLQRLYGSLGHFQHQHDSRASLPDIAEGDEARLLTSSVNTSDQDLFSLDLHNNNNNNNNNNSHQNSGSMQYGTASTSGGLHQTDLALVGTMPSHDALSRSLLVRGLPSSVTEQQVRTIFEAFGEIATVYCVPGNSGGGGGGYVILSYYDIRAATLAHHTLHGTSASSSSSSSMSGNHNNNTGGASPPGSSSGGSMSITNAHNSNANNGSGGALGPSLHVLFTPGRPGEGCLLVGSRSPTSGSSTSLSLLDNTAPPPPPSISELWQLFSLYGEVKDVTMEAPERPECRLVEFFDTRHAKSALDSLTGSAELMTKLVLIDATQLSASSGMHVRNNSGGSGSDIRGLLVDPSSVLQQHHHHHHYHNPPQQQQHHIGTAPAGSTILGTSPLLSGGGGGSTNNNNNNNGTTNNMVPGMSASDLLAGMSRSLSEMSLDAAVSRGVGGGGLSNHGSVGHPLGSFAGMSMSTGDLMRLNAAHHQQQQQQQHHHHHHNQRNNSGGVGGVGGLRGIASTGSIWPNTSSSSLLGTSPVGSSASEFWGAGGGDHGHAFPGSASAGQLHDALAQQLLHQQQQHAQQQQMAMRAALQQALAQQQQQQQQQQVAALGYASGNVGSSNLLAAAGSAGALSALINSRVSTAGGPRIELPPLGGRLARRPLDPSAEAERKAQQERLYALDLVKIAAGDDKRTTLMIKNIPNKYTQKMLLNLLEEKFKGTFDFFYLPIDFKNKCNVGYAFINMVAPKYIPPLVREFHSKRWPKFNSEKVCAIAYGRIQGKSALVSHFQNSSLLHEDKRCRPVLFHNNGDTAVDAEPFPMGPTPLMRSRGGGGSTGALNDGTTGF